ncbi:MAG TPA: c-type cytochrome [Anaerolineales bacterium]|nr:c-type cytochrome [Anaerolineales bacterium]
MGNARINKTYDFPATNLEIPTDAESLAYGKYRVETLCAGCHGADLSGLENWFDGGPLGTIDSANLTSGEGGIGDDFSTEDFVRAIRHGIDQDGKPIFMIAVGATSHLSDEDLASIIAYVRTVPPVDHAVAGKQFTPLAKILFAAGVLPNMPVEEVSHEVNVSAPARGASTEYGEYMVNINDCRICHGPNLNGGPFPDPTITRISPNLTPGGELAFWTEADFINTIRTGVTPGGHELDPKLLPWNEYRNLHDYELQAIWMYLQSLPELSQYTE